MHRMVFIFVLSGSALVASPAFGQVEPRSTWNGNDKEWNVAAEWTGGVPAAGSIANIFKGTSELKAGKTGTAKFLHLGHTGNAEGVCNVSGGTLDIAQQVTLGGSNTVGGRLKLSAGVVKCEVLSIGRMGRGTVEQSGGEMGTAAAPLKSILLSETNASLGLYDLSGGTINTNKLSVGLTGPGEFTQSGGTVNVLAKEMEVGWTFTGSYTMSDGTLNSAKALFLGTTTLGTFTQSGGTVNADSLAMGRKVTANGDYQMSGGAVNIQTTASVGNKGNATLKITGGTFKVKDDMNVAEASGAGSVQVAGGKLLVDQSLWLNGTAGGAAGDGSAELRATGDGTAGGVVRVTVNGTLKTYRNSTVYLFRNGIVECGKDEVGAGRRQGNGKIKKLGAFGSSEPFFTADPGSAIVPEDDDSAYGRIEVDGDAVLAGSLVDIQLGGDEPGITHDQFTVTGPLSLDGAVLSVSFGPGMRADDLVPGMEFVVVEGHPIIGSFSFIDLPDLTSDRALVAMPYADAIVLRVVATGD